MEARMKQIIMVFALPAFFVIGYLGTNYYMAPDYSDFRMPASSRDLPSKGVPATYAIKDGYGEYRGIGATKLKAREMAWEKCVQSKVIAYENRHGNTPDASTADLFIDSCINK